MRLSLWLLLAAVTAFSFFWMLLVILSDFMIWSASNLAGLTLQAVLILSPLALFIGLKASEENLRRTVALFVLAWGLVFGLTLLLLL